MDDEEDLQPQTKRLADFAVYVIVRFFVAFVQVLPYDMADCLCRLTANLFTHVIPVRRKTFQDNMRRVFPTRRQLSGGRFAKRCGITCC